jgi:hypothetical protein
MLQWQLNKRRKEGRKEGRKRRTFIKEEKKKLFGLLFL